MSSSSPSSLSSSESFEFTVSASDASQRLDMLVVELLARAGKQVSRSSVRTWLDKGRVLVDGQKVKAGAHLKAGARLTVEPEPPPPSEASPDPSVSVSLLYEDPHLWVVDKPAGLVVHPAKGHWSGTLVNGLLALDSGSGDEGELDDDDPQRPGIVHRLDKDTSGVMVVARTAEAREGLKALFSKHDIEREYQAVVVGKAKDATYDTPHGRHPTQRLRFSTRSRGPTRRAITHVKVIESLAQGRASLVACRLETGRTHQIRVHLSECGGTPLLGDALYGHTPKDPALAVIAKQLGRHWLHAWLLGFVHPITGEKLRFSSALPKELVESLEQLRSL